MNEDNKPIAEFDITKLEYPVALPCNARCPVCGSGQAKRQYDPDGLGLTEKLDCMYRNNYLLHRAQEDNDKAKIEKYKTLLADSVAAVNSTPCVPRIKNTCLCCGYNYDTKPLNVQ